MKQVMAIPIGPALRLQVDAHEGWQRFVHGYAVYLDGTSYLARNQRPLPALWFFSSHLFILIDPGSRNDIAECGVQTFQRGGPQCQAPWNGVTSR